MKEKQHCHDGGDEKRPELELVINGKIHHWPDEYITGYQIRELGKIDEDDEIFLAVKAPWSNEQIFNDTRVNLARPEIENFFSNPQVCTVTLIVNGISKHWDKSKISFEEVLLLAFGSYDNNPNIVYTVAYEDGPERNPEGSMVWNDKVKVKNKMIFHATATDKS